MSIPISKITTEFLDHVYASKKDFTPDDFRVLIGNNMLPITPEIVAEMFACFDSESQARFFNHIDKVASSWHGGFGALSFQMQAITDGWTYLCWPAGNAGNR